jgi:hypothetical protein
LPIWDFNQSAGLVGTVSDGRAPRPKRFSAIAAFIIMFSPEHRLFDYEDTTMSMMRNVQIVWNCRNARRKAIKVDSPAFKQFTLTF